MDRGLSCYFLHETHAFLSTIEDQADTRDDKSTLVMVRVTNITLTCFSMASREMREANLESSAAVEGF